MFMRGDPISREIGLELIRGYREHLSCSTAPRRSTAIMVHDQESFMELNRLLQQGHTISGAVGQCSSGGGFLVWLVTP